MSSARVALVQMNSAVDVEATLVATRRLALEAAAGAADFICLPENFACLGNPDPRGVADRYAGEIAEFLAKLARETGCWLFAGTAPRPDRPDGSPVPDGRVRAASLVFDGSGREVARYDKIHMFDVDVADGHRNYRESATFEHGADIVVVETPIGPVGLTVCYDIRFSELFLSLAREGVVAFMIPSAFTVPTGIAHFELLCRARAVESFAYVLSACQGGTHDSGRVTYGHSVAVNPWGEVIARAEGDAPGVVFAELDTSQVSSVRRDMPVHQQRRL